MRKKSEEIIKSLVAHYSLPAILNTFDDAKVLSRSDLKKLFQPATQQKGKKPCSAAPKPDGTPAARIRRLLRVEAKLSGPEAIEAIKNELRGKVPMQTPMASGFDAWLETVLKQVPAGEILNAAMTIAARTGNGTRT